MRMKLKTKTKGENKFTPSGLERRGEPTIVSDHWDQPQRRSGCGHVVGSFLCSFMASTGSGVVCRAFTVAKGSDTGAGKGGA